MKVAIDMGPVKTGHAVRGVGVYTENLVKGLRSLEAGLGLEVEEWGGGAFSRNVDLVHYPYFDLFYHTLSLRKRLPTVVTIHDVIPLVFPEHYPPGLRGRFNLRLQKLALRGVEAVVTDSDCSKRDIHKYFGVPLKQIHRVYLAGQPQVSGDVSEDELSRVKEKYNLPESFVLYVGDVNYNKNLLSLVKAVKRVRIQNTEFRIQNNDKSNLKLETGNLKLVVVGRQAVSEDFDRSHIENQALVEFQRMCEESDDVLRLGYVPTKELGAIYGLATCYCQPSFYEGFGVPVLEAMAAGCPVVSTKGGSLAEVGGKAAIYTGTSPKSIAGGLRLVLGLSNAQRKRLVQEGIKQAGRFSWEKAARETVDVYKEILKIK
jgi:glycosyltransferase involved in cell wall biosynthesis